MVSSENGSHGWTYAIAGTAFLIGGSVMFFDPLASKLFLVTLLIGPTMLGRGIFLIKQNRHGQSRSSAGQGADDQAETNLDQPPQEKSAAGQTQSSQAPQPQPEPEPAWLREAFSVEPLPPIVALATVTVPAVDDEAKEPQKTAPAEDFFNQGLWGYVLPCTFFVGVLVLVAYMFPHLINNWRLTEARGEAEAAYIKRRAELRAELEHGEEVLDRPNMQVSRGFRAVVQKVTPMVVSVGNLKEKFDPALQPIPIYDPALDRRLWQVSIGTGFVAKVGYILTNHHVVKDADHVRITFASGQSVFIPQSAISSDHVMDLAIIRMPPNEDMKSALEFADSDKDVNVGDWSLTIGSPLGLKHTTTHGIISAKGRLTNWLPVELLQTDTAINPGNSGGPLLDQFGRVVGVNVALASENGRNQGIGFAIPSNAARKIFERLVADGRNLRGYLGIGLTELFGKDLLELSKQDVGGVVIEHVAPGSPASKSDPRLRAGDIIVRFNNEALARTESLKHLQQMVASVDPGSKASLVVLRNGRRIQVDVVLGTRPDKLP